MNASFTRRSRRRLNHLIKHRIKTNGDFCTLCRAAFTDNALTFYGIAHGAVVVTGSCCRARLDPEIAAGIYIAATSINKGRAS